MYILLSILVSFTYTCTYISIIIMNICTAKSEWWVFVQLSYMFLYTLHVLYMYMHVQVHVICLVHVHTCIITYMVHIMCTTGFHLEMSSIGTKGEFENFGGLTNRVIVVCILANKFQGRMNALIQPPPKWNPV